MRPEPKLLRVLMVVPSWKTRCGVASYSQELKKSLNVREVQVEVRSGDLESLPANAGSKHFDLVHFQYQYSLYDLGQLSRCALGLALQRIPSLVTMHDYYPAMTHENEFIRRSFSGVVVHSEAIRQAFAGSSCRNAVRVIPMGCPTPCLPPAAQCREALGLRDEPAIGFFGFMAPQKGILNLLRAVRALRQTHPDLRCFVYSAVGTSSRLISQECLDRLRAACEREKLWGGVQLETEYLPEEVLATRLHGMTVNVLPYQRDNYYGCSMAARLLLAVERPLVTTDIPFFADLGSEVCKIPSGGPEFIVAAVSRLLSHPEACGDLVKAAHDFTVRNSWDNAAGLHADFYRELMKCPRQPQVLVFEGETWR